MSMSMQQSPARNANQQSLSGPLGMSMTAVAAAGSQPDALAASSAAPTPASAAKGASSASAATAAATAAGTPGGGSLAPPQPWHPVQDEHPLTDEAATDFTKGCNPGPRQADFVESAMMPFVGPALAKLLESKPADPVHALTMHLRDAVAEARRRPTAKRGDTLGAVATQAMPVLLDGDTAASPSLNQTLTRIDAAKLEGRPMTAEQESRARRWVHELEFTSRPCPLAQGKPLPTRFQRSGQHAVFGIDLPTAKEMSLVVRHIVSETGAQHIKWVVVGLGDVQVFHNGRPYRATPTPHQWQAFRSRVDNDEDNKYSATNRRSALNVQDPLWMHEQMELECIRSIQQSVKAVNAAETRRNVRIARDANDAASGSEPADVLLSVTSAEERAQTPMKKQRPRYEGVMSKSVVSVQSAISSACDAIRNIDHSYVRLQHPDDAVCPPVVGDMVTQVCDSIGNLANTAVVVVGCDRWALVKHIQAMITLYYVVESELQHVRRLINASDAAGGISQQTFAKDVTKEVLARRKARDERRDWLIRAHVSGEGGSSGASDAATLLERRTHIKQARNQRRRRDDVRRHEIDDLQSDAAGKKIGKLAASFIRRKREDGGGLIGRRVGGPTLAPGGEGESSSMDVEARRKKLLSAYREGEYPLITKLIDSLLQSFGVEFLTTEPPPTGAAKAFRQWHVTMKRVDPVDDLDVSSEEEDWTSTMTERVRHNVATAFNPLHDVQVALRLAGSNDLQLMADTFENYAGLASLQRKGMQAMERVGAMVMYASFLSFHHKKRLSAEFGTTITSPLMSQLLRLPPKLQGGSSYRDFVRASAVGQTILDHGSWVTTFSVAQPSLLHPPSATRVLLAAPTKTGGFIPSLAHSAIPTEAAAEGAARASMQDMLQQLNPKTAFFLAPDHLTVDQWTDTVAAALKKATGTRRVLWLSMRPDFTVYVNETPLFATSRPELVGHDSSLPRYSTIHTANLNGAFPAVYLKKDPPLNVSGPADAFFAAKAQAATLAAAKNQARSGATSRRSSASRQRGSDARDMVVRSPTPLGEMPASTTESTAVRRSQAHPVKDQPLPSGWLGVNVDAVERELCSEVIDLIDASEDGKLVCYTASAAVAGAGIVVSSVDTMVHDRPSSAPEAGPLGALARLNARPAGAVSDGTSNAPSKPVSPTTVSVRDLPTTAGQTHTSVPAIAPAALGGSVSLAPTEDATQTAQVSGRTEHTNRAAGTTSPGASMAPIETSDGDGADAPSAITCVVPERSDVEVCLTQHPVQALRPRRHPAPHQQPAYPAVGGARGSTWTTSSGANALGVPSGAGASMAAPDGTPSEAPLSPTGAVGTSTAIPDCVSDTPSMAHHARMSDKASVARTVRGPQLDAQRKTVRGIQGLRQRQLSVASAASDGVVVDEGSSQLHLPTRAADAVMTPWQAADEVRLRLKRRYSLDNAITFRRAPFFRATGELWMHGIDQIYQLAHEQLADQYLAVVFGVSDADSIFASLLCTIVWAVEHGKSSMLGVAESNLPTSGQEWANGTALEMFTATSVSEFAGTREPETYSPFGSMHRLVAENMRSDMLDSLKFVDVILQQTAMHDVIVGPIEHYMRLAEREAQRFADAGRIPSLPERQLMLWYAKKASQALERYMLLVLFHHFVRFIQEQRQVMSVMQVDFSFAEHVHSLQNAAQILSDLDPWEGQPEMSPLTPFSVTTTPEFRWRSRNWVATIG